MECGFPFAVRTEMAMEMTDILAIIPNAIAIADATEVRTEAEIEDTEQIDRHSHAHHAGTMQMQMEIQLAEETATTKEKMLKVAGGEEQQQVAGIQTIWSVAET